MKEVERIQNEETAQVTKESIRADIGSAKDELKAEVKA
jgi:hypothetical protein